MKKKKIDIVNLFFIGITIITLSMTIAYSSLTTSLTISGEAVFEVAQSSDVIISDLICTSSSTPLGDINYSNYNVLNLSLGIELPALTSKVTCTATVTNKKSNMIKFTSISTDHYNNQNIDYAISGLYINDIINKNSTRNLVLTFEYKEDIDVLPESITLDTELLLKFRTIANDNIVEDGLTFYLSGEDAINSANMWPERISGKDVTLYGNITRDVNKKAYYFSGESTCGYTNETLIPISEPVEGNDYGSAKDFTIEVLFTSLDYETNSSIIAQKRLRTISTTNEVGRFKPFDIDKGLVRYFWQYSDSSQSLNNYGLSNIVSGTSLYLTLVNNGNTIRKYVNGVRTGTNTLEDPVISKYTTQIGCFSTYDKENGISASQNYYGYIKMIRIYNKALTPEQISSNYAIDQLKYVEIPDQIEKDLKTFALNDEVKSDGSGLYVDSNYEIVNDNSRYVFKGLYPNNYIILGEKHYDENFNIIEDEQVWRIMSFETDGTMKLIKQRTFPTAFDDAGNRYITPKSINDIGYSPYCKDSEIPVTASGTDYKGCNAFAKMDTFGMNENLYTIESSGKSAVANDSTIAKKLNNLGSGSFFTNDEKDIINSNEQSVWDIGLVTYSTTTSISSLLDEINDYKWTGKVGTLSVYDFIMSNSEEFTGVNQDFLSSYIGNLTLLKSIDIWTINGAYDSSLSTFDVYCITTYIYDSDTKVIKKRRASRQEIDSSIMNVAPVIRINSDIVVTGTGEQANPFRIVSSQ